jgi:transglutaminase-like putative cysteine protease
MTTPDVTHRRVADEVALALVTVAVVVGFSRLFDRATFYPPLLGAALLAHVAAALTRRSRNVLAGPIMLVVGFVATIDLTAWSTTTYGVPTPSTLGAAGRELRRSWHSLSSVVAPTAPTTGFLLAAAIAVWVAAWAADRLAFRFAAPVEALAPTTTLFLFGTLLAGPRHRVVCTAAFGIAALAHVLVERTVRSSTRETALRAGPDDAGWRTIGAGTTMAAAALVLGLGAVAVVPVLSTDGLVEVRAHRPNDAPRSVVSPLVDIRSRLLDQRDDVMFRVTASQPAYWRLMSLDEFDGTIWSSNQHFRSAGVRLPSGGEETTGNARSKNVVATFEILGLGGPWAPAPFRATGVSGTKDLLWDPNGATLIARAAKGDVGGLRYRVDAKAPVVTSAAARASGSGTIPGDIARTDLALPADFPGDLVTLAHDIVKGKATPYAKALALQNYFRNNPHFSYSTEVAAGQDINAIRQFLQRGSGYCEQFAGTYAALARAVGLPTRVAVGFTSGDPQGNGSFLVHGRNAHAWPEVYLSGLGWLPFEPTPGRGNPDATAYTGVVPQQAGPGNDPAITVPAPTIAPTTTVADSAPTTTAAPSPTLAPLPPPTNAPPGAPRPSSGPPGWLTPLIIGVAAVALLLGTGPYLRHRRRTRRRLADPSPAGRVRVAWLEVLEAWAPHRLVRRASDTDLDMGVRLAERLAVRAPGSTLPATAHRLAELSTTANWHASGIAEDDADEATELAFRLEAQAEVGRPWPARMLTRLDPRRPRGDRGPGRRQAQSS